MYVTPMESNEQRGIGIENESKRSNGTVNFDQTSPTEKVVVERWTDFSKLFRLDRADPLSFRPKFPEILVEWIAPSIKLMVPVVSSFHHQFRDPPF